MVKSKYIRLVKTEYVNAQTHAIRYCGAAPVSQRQQNSFRAFLGRCLLFAASTNWGSTKPVGSGFTVNFQSGRAPKVGGGRERKGAVL